MRFSGLFIKGAEKEVIIGKGDEEEQLPVPEELPVLPLRNTVIYPLIVLPLAVQRPRSVRLVDDAVVADRLVALVGLKDPEIEDPTPSDVYTVGTMAMIHRLARAPARLGRQEGHVHLRGWLDHAQGVPRCRERLGHHRYHDGRHGR